MKQYLLFLILIIFGFLLSNAQQTISETEKLASLGKMYGFLKYYHPEVAKGKYDWDEELIKQLPLVLRAADKESLSAIYIDWINSLGKVEPCRKCDSTEDYFDKNFDLSWTQNVLLYNIHLTEKLKHIENNRLLGEHYYAENGPAGAIEIKNEKEYQNFEYPVEQFRILALFKYWNVIEYFYPYKYLMDQPWDSVLSEMIPRFRKAANQNEYQNSIKELVGKLDDAHAFVSFDNEQIKYLPVGISDIQNQAVVSRIYNDSIANLNNFKLGDVILKINNNDISEKLNRNLKYVAGSNSNNKIKKTYDQILSGSERILKLTIERNGKVKEITSNRYDFAKFKYWNDVNAIKSISITSDIGYLKMANIKSPKDIADIFESFENKKIIIIDLRKYPNSNYMAFSRFLNSEKREFARSYSPDINYPSRFVFKKNLESNRSKKAFNGKIILLVNENTLSLAEFTAMAFQTADDVITVGNQTAGADGNGVYFNFLGGFRTSISGLGFHYPDGTESQRHGVKIDIEVKPTINGLRQGRDEVLEKAIQLASQ